MAEYRYVHEKKKRPHQKEPKSQERLDAERGKFNFTEIHGFTLKEVDWEVPPLQVRKRKRAQFAKIRVEFLKELGRNHEAELRAMGMSDKDIKQVKKGTNPNGYNVHHKLPLHGGGQNEFSNFILMPIKEHDDLHHKVMDPQVQNMQTGDKKKVVIPWTDDMVYVSPEKKKARQKAAIIAKVANRSR